MYHTFADLLTLYGCIVWVIPLHFLHQGAKNKHKIYMIYNNLVKLHQFFVSFTRRLLTSYLHA